jgi:hypothetical protein
MSKRTPVKPWHVLALVVGAPLLLLWSFARIADPVTAIAMASIGATFVGWFASRFLPRTLAGALVVAVTVFACIRARGIVNDDASRWRAENQAAVMKSVCDGVAFTGQANAKLRVVYARENTTWLDQSSWPVHQVPEFFLCVRETQQTVQSGTFEDKAHPDRGPITMSTYRHLADVELRRTSTAEVVFTKHYVGGEAPPLPSYIANSTLLGGSPVSYETIHKDIADHLQASVATTR